MRLNPDDAVKRIECTCSRRPLLALGGRDRITHQGFVWIRTTKAHKVMAEIVVTEGTVAIRCRECLRFWTIRIVRDPVRPIQQYLVSDDMLKDFSPQGH